MDESHLVASGVGDIHKIKLYTPCDNCGHEAAQHFPDVTKYTTEPCRICGCTTLKQGDTWVSLHNMDSVYKSTIQALRESRLGLIPELTADARCATCGHQFRFHLDLAQKYEVPCEYHHSPGAPICGCQFFTTTRVKLPIVTSIYDDHGKRLFDKDSDHEWWCSHCGNAVTITGNFMQCTACRVASQGGPNTDSTHTQDEICPYCDHPRSYHGEGCTFVFDQGHRCFCMNWDKHSTDYADTSDDPVNHPSHYTSHPSGIECIQITEHMTFNLGNAIKYLWRADLKNGVEDLEKAAWYVNREIQRRKQQQV